MSNLKEKYNKEIIKKLMKRFGYKSQMQVPKLVKVVLNRGVSDATVNSKATEDSAEELAQISGQKPLITLAKKAIAAFKLKKGLAIGCKVTLRGERMYLFMNKLINICLPRIRDFRGLNPKSFDGHGGYSFGLKEQLIFPEIVYDKVDKVRGMDITIQTSAKTGPETMALLEEFGIPFVK